MYVTKYVIKQTNYKVSDAYFCRCLQKCRKRNAVTSDVTSDASSTSSNTTKPEVACTFNFRSAAVMGWTNGADSAGSYADDVTLPEVKWHAVESSSPVTSYPVGGMARQSEMATWWPTGLITHPSPDREPMSKKIKPEVVHFDIRSAAGVMNWTEDDQSLVSRGSPGNYADDVTVPEITRNTMTSYAVSKSSPQPEMVDWWPTGFMTHPSPDPLPETASTPAFQGPVCIHSEWPSPGDSEASPHDQWLEASCWTTYEDTRLHNIYRTNKLNDSDFCSQQQRFDSLSDQSLGGVIYESLEGASGVCWPFDNDYIDDALAVMANAAS